MPSTIKLQGDLETRFYAFKNRLADQLGDEPTDEAVVERLMDEYASNTSPPPTDVRQEKAATMED